MNNPNPFLPQGVFLEEKNKARARLKIAVYFSISLSVMVLMVLLIQGCKKPADSADNGNPSDTTASTQLANPQPDSGSSNTTALTNPAPQTNPSPMVSTPPPVATPPPMATPPPPVAEMQEYTIVQGDTLDKIHTNLKVSVKAIIDANPGLDPKRLKIGQKIKIPAPTSSSSTSVAAPGAQMNADTASAGSAITYKVKSGDNLTHIATLHHVTVKAIQSANNLGSSTSIKVGQVLKIPGSAAPAPTPDAAPAPAPAPMH